MIDIESNKNTVCYSHLGKRLNHEDNFFMNGHYLTPEMRSKMPETQCCFFSDAGSTNVNLIAVSDGMGGHNAGEIASQICMEELASVYEELIYYTELSDIVEYLQKVIAGINEKVCKLSSTRDDLRGMGATLVIYVSFGDECAILNIGDSRGYQFHHGVFWQITKDHTEGQRVLDLGLLTRKELPNFPARKNLNRYIGYNQKGYVLQADVYYLSVKKGFVLLCSDGVSDSLSDMRLSEILCSEQNSEIAGKKIIDEAVLAQEADNTTLILIPIGV